MKVLQSGDGRKGYSVEMKCTGGGNGGGGCGAELLVELDDMRQHTQHDYGGGSDDYVLFKCPECHVWTDIPSGKWPPDSDKLKHYSRRQVESDK